MSCPEYLKNGVCGWLKLPFCVVCDCITNDIRLRDFAVISFILPAKLTNFSNPCKFPIYLSALIFIRL